MSSEWNMPRRAEQCGRCGRTFESGEPFHAYLYKTDAGYARHDYCESCPPAAEPAALGSWRTRRPEPTVRKLQPFDREAIYGFFQRLEDAHEPGQVQFRFVLALLLWRKKVLKLEQTRDEPGGEVWEFTMPRTGSVHRVERPDLDEAQLERLSTQLELLMAGRAGDAGLVAPDLNTEADHV